jgi:hypothetical protein
MAKKKTAKNTAQAAKLLKKSKTAAKSVTKTPAKPAPVAAKRSKPAPPPSKKPGKPPVRATEKKSRVLKEAARAVVKKTASPRQKPVARPAKPVETSNPQPSLGRPLVTQEERLYMLFHDDYQSRQVFEFLQVETVKQLEDYSPQQIVYLMSKPIRQTVDRIRQRLAQYKRSLKDDQHFAAMVQQQTLPMIER